jgi:hypothetical protein
MAGPPNAVRPNRKKELNREACEGFVAEDVMWSFYTGEWEYCYLPYIFSPLLIPLDLFNRPHDYYTINDTP